ncbi:MAG: dihydroneopterin aldolase [Magnetococcales bacterium]|nr:dihydroneopterin aldolase [Magnetococcales bacterium]
MSGTNGDRIDIRDLHLRTLIGIEDWERKNRQDVMLQLTLWTDLTRAGRSDRIEDTVNYKTLAKRVIALTEASSFQLVEALAQRVADLCLDDPGVERVRVQVDKPGALRFARTVGVTIERCRS